jgi:histidinol-phosphate/aromatic aminotransferase/cobyric acid decarboxylase-like protein
VLENGVQCQVSRFTLRRAAGFVIDNALLREVQQGYDLIVLVNPNSPTGTCLPRPALENMLSQVPASTLVWVDETYIEYAGQATSIEPFAVTTENVVVCKSMSKVYALSGVRSAYLCSSPHLLETLRSLKPPWAISLPAQAAAIAALTDGDYYQKRYAQTHALRDSLKQDLQNLGITDIVDGMANFLLFYLPADVDAVAFLAWCQQENLFLRSVGSIGTELGHNAIRISVKDTPTTKNMVVILQRALVHCTVGERPA